MIESIGPVGAEQRLAQLLGNDSVAQVDGPSAAGLPVSPAGESGFTGNIFEDVLSRAIGALNGVSRQENQANQMIEGYLRGEVEMHEVMIAQSKASIMVNLAVTTVNAAVTTFKEITQMQV